MANSPGVAELLVFDANNPHHWDFLLTIAAKSRAQRLLDSIAAASHPHKDEEGQSKIHDRIESTLMVGYPSKTPVKSVLTEEDYAANRRALKSMFRRR